MASDSATAGMGKFVNLLLGIKFEYRFARQILSETCCIERKHNFGLQVVREAVLAKFAQPMQLRSDEVTKKRHNEFLAALVARHFSAMQPLWEAGRGDPAGLNNRAKQEASQLPLLC